MKLFTSPTSPYGRKARVLVLEKNIACDIIFANPWESEARVLTANPLRKIPILMDDDGATVVDSRVICEFLDAQTPSPKFLPDDFTARIAVKTREAMCDGALDSATAVVMAGRVDAEMKSEKWRRWLLSKTESVLSKLADEGCNLGDSDNAASSDGSDNLDLGDIAAVCLLDFLSFRLPEMRWDESHPGLAAWGEKMLARDSFVQTDPRR